MLKDEPIAYIQEQFEEKHEVLSQFGEEVSAWTMYEDIFDDMSIQKIRLLLLIHNLNIVLLQNMKVLMGR